MSTSPYSSDFAVSLNSYLLELRFTLKYHIDIKYAHLVEGDLTRCGGMLSLSSKLLFNCFN